MPVFSRIPYFIPFTLFKWSSTAILRVLDEKNWPKNMYHNIHTQHFQLGPFDLVILDDVDLKCAHRELMMALSVLELSLS